ncbi:MAG: hypothetical protein HZB68_03900 [Candidatus Aenigmarchaeota archaeon]|nr:hypothetical protein [Candidatus Aenigmarchaeota archaeon]
MKAGLLVLLVFIAGCSQQAAEKSYVKFSCENNYSIGSRGYVLLMGLAQHQKSDFITEKNLMDNDPKAKFAVIYDQDETLHIDEIGKKFLQDMNELLSKHEIDELVIFGSSAGGVTASYSIAKLNFSRPVALHTLASPLKGYDLTGFRSNFLGDRKGYLRDIAIGFGPFGTPGDSVKVYHHKTVNDTVLKEHYCGQMASFCDVREIQNNNIGGSKEFYYPQYDHNPLGKYVIREVLKCYNSELPESPINSEKTGLGELCANEEECNIFCKDSVGRCKDYCKSNTENPICQKPFAFEGS